MRIYIRKLFYIILGIVILLPFQNCSPVHRGPDENSSLAAPGSFASVQQKVLKSCVQCHSSVPPAGNYDLTTYDKVMEGGRVMANSPGTSLLYQVIESGQMPPGNPLDPALVDEVKMWIEAGATGENIDVVNQSPVANAGVDREYTLPTGGGASVQLYGRATDGDGSIANVVWTQVSGPAASLTGGGTLTPTVTDLTAGVYVFRLEATDNLGAKNSDSVQLTVIP